MNDLRVGGLALHTLVNATSALDTNCAAGGKLACPRWRQTISADVGGQLGPK